MYGTSNGFNNQWTLLTSIRRGGEIHGWQFQCGCGYQTTFLTLHYDNPYAAALTTRDFHICRQEVSKR